MEYAQSIDSKAAAQMARPSSLYEARGLLNEMPSGLNDRVEQMQNEATEIAAMLQDICTKLGAPEIELGNVGSEPLERDQVRNLTETLRNLSRQLSTIRSRASRALNAL